MVWCWLCGVVINDCCAFTRIELNSRVKQEMRLHRKLSYSYSGCFLNLLSRSLLKNQDVYSSQEKQPKRKKTATQRKSAHVRP